MVYTLWLGRVALRMTNAFSRHGRATESGKCSGGVVWTEGVTREPGK